MEVKNKCLHPISVPRVTGVTARILRCGHCPNCLRQKANELAVRAYREFVGQQVVFVTLTYNDEHCPVMVNRYNVDTDTGEMSFSDSGVVRDLDFYRNAPFKPIRYKDNGVIKLAKRYYPLSVLCENVDSKVMTYETRCPTVYYEDVKLLLKRFRMRYPDTLKQYLAVQEYGGKSYRPHYHLVLYGLNKEQVNSLANDWSKICGYGDVDIRYLQSKTDDTLQQQVGKVAMYIAKYCCKGKFDCPYINQSLCSKPKRAVSNGFGKGSDESFERLCKRVLAYDSFGNVDAWQFDTADLSKRDLSLLISRRTCDVNGVHMPFPKYLVNKIFKKTIKVLTYENRTCKIVPCGYKLSDGDKIGLSKTSYKTISSPLQTKIANSILSDLVTYYMSEQGKLFGSFESVSQSVSLFEDRQKIEQDDFEAAVRQFKTDIYLHSRI